MSDENINKENIGQANNKSWWKKLCIFAFLLLLINIICCGCSNLKLNNESVQDKGKWIVVDDEMSKRRNFATANLLPDGNVLIMGGEDKSADTADIFDPNQMKIVKTIPLDDKRYFGYSATTLKNGDVFVAGGYIVPEKRIPHLTNATMLFDYKKYLFRETEPMKEPPSDIQTFLLENGHVLILHNPRNHLLEEIKKREYIKFQVYDPIKNEYYETKNTIHRLMVGQQHMILDNGDVLFKCFYRLPGKTDKGLGSTCLYNWKENNFEVADEIPHEQLFIQLDSENYLTMTPELEHTEGYTYNIKTKEKIPVNNKINRTWRPGIRPQMVLLENGDVLILAIPLKNGSDEYELTGKNRKTAKYSAYIYDRKNNIFYEIPAPPYPVYDAGIVKLKNGDILLAGGKVNYHTISNKIQIFKYKKIRSNQ